MFHGGIVAQKSKDRDTAPSNIKTVEHKKMKIFKNAKLRAQMYRQFPPYSLSIIFIFVKFFLISNFLKIPK
jgi:hypothetical protein